ncbi:hypothetical protein QJQ45_022416, partial [Haematococcus lacustris]
VWMSTRNTLISSAVNGQQPREEELDHEQPTRPADWKPPAGQVDLHILRPAWSQQCDQPVRGLMWCPVVIPRKPPLAPCSSQEATLAGASELGPSTPPPAKRSKRTEAEQAAEPTQPTKGKGMAQGKAAKATPAPQPGRWLDRDCNAALNMQRIGESRWRPLELCYWPDQGALPAKGKEYPGGLQAAARQATQGPGAAAAACLGTSAKGRRKGKVRVPAQGGDLFLDSGIARALEYQRIGEGIQYPLESSSRPSLVEVHFMGDQLQYGPKLDNDKLPKGQRRLAPRKPPQAPCSSQEATPAAASAPGPSTPPPAKRSKRTKAEQGKAAKVKAAPQPGRWLDRDCNAALNMQRIGESRWRPLELCYWPDQGALPAKGKEYPGFGYKRLRDKPPKAQQQQQQPVEAHEWMVITPWIVFDPASTPASPMQSVQPWDERSGQLVTDQLRRWKLTKGQLKHDSGLNNARRDTERWLAPIKPHLQQLAAASSGGTSLEANLKHVTVTLATWDAEWEVYLDPKWARQRLRLYGAQDRALEQFFKKLEEDMAEVSMERHGRAEQLVVFFGAASIGTGGGWGADAVLRACCKVVCRPRGAGQRRGRVVLVDEHRTTRVSSAVNGQQPCEEELNQGMFTRPAGWKPPEGQVEPSLLRPAWSQQRDQPVRGLMWCPIVAPRKPPQAPCSSQKATPSAASEPGPSTPHLDPSVTTTTPPLAKRSKHTEAEQAAEPTQPSQPTKGKGKAQGKAAKTTPAPQPGRWLDRNCNVALNMQRIGESRWRPLELCWWPEQTALPAKGKEYPGLGYKRLRDKPPKAQQQQQQPAVAQ